MNAASALAGVCGQPAGHAGGRIKRSPDLRGEKQGQAAQVRLLLVPLPPSLLCKRVKTSEIR